MERKIGEIFIYKDKTYQAVEVEIDEECKGCAFEFSSCCTSLLGDCSPTHRTDGASVIFKEINNMENNQLTIDIPEGMEIDLENSDLAKGIVKFKKKYITYENVQDALKLGKNCKSIIINEGNASKLVALSKLMNIAKYYNGDWKPDWSNIDKYKYYITYNGVDDTYTSFYCKHYLNSEDKNKIVYYEEFLCTTAKYSLEDKDTIQTYIKTIEEKLGIKLNRETLEIEKTQPEFKDGDIIVTASIPSMCYSKCIFILKGDLYAKDSKTHSYVFYNISNNHISFDVVDTIIRDREIRLATNPEKLQLFGMLTKEGKYWDAANKQILDLKEYQFKPFEKVLVRDSYDDVWRASFFSHIKENGGRYVTTYVTWKFCIPYEGNEHLLGTTNNVGNQI